MIEVMRIFIVSVEEEAFGIGRRARTDVFFSLFFQEKVKCDIRCDRFIDTDTYWTVQKSHIAT